MDKKLLDYLVCSEDGGKLNFIKYKNGGLEGVLRCLNGHCYPVFYNVPVIIKNEELLEFLNNNEKNSFFSTLKFLKIDFPDITTRNYKLDLLKQTSLNWSKQWESDRLENTIWENKSTFLKHIPMNDELLKKSKFILEIGCGNGRNIRHVRREDNIVFAIDISTSAYYVKQKYAKHDNVFIIKCDANHLPFSNDFFDLVFSDHVLQHIYNLEDCFKEIKRVSKGNGSFIFNLYSKENNFIMTKFFEPLKIVFKKLPLFLIELISSIPAFFLWLVIKLIYSPANKHASKFYTFLPLYRHFTFWLPMSYKTLKTVCFDLLHAPVAYYYGEDDIDELCGKTHFKLIDKHLFGQTLWICLGEFIK